MISPETFLAAMRVKWSEFGNVLSPALEQAWTQIASAFQAQIDSTTLPRPVIPAELGAGKTTCAKMFCAICAKSDVYPGILVVVRTTKQADEYADDINAWSGKNVALAWYTKKKPLPTPQEIAKFPVVVICHKSYELALDEKMVDESERFEKFTTFCEGGRRLTIVDEALEQVYIARLPQRLLWEIRGLLPPKVVKENRFAFKLLDSVDHALLDAPNGNAVISAEKLLAGTRLTAPLADATIRMLWSSISDQLPTDRRSDVKEALTALRRQLAAYAWTESEHARTAVVSSRLLLPPDAGQVFLDATGRLNSVYLGRPDQFHVLDTPQVRNYQPVTLNVARVKRTGKFAMKDEGDKIASETMTAVSNYFGEDASQHRVLVIADEASESMVRQVWSSGPFAEVATTHWGAVDGRNDWREFDTVVMVSLPWATRTLDLAHWRAIQDIEPDTSTLNNPPDGVRLVREQRISSMLAQALGRIRLRRMVHADGTCEPCWAFVRLPHSWAVNHLDSDHVLKGIQRTLVGLQVADWAILSEKKTPAGRKPRALEVLTQALLAMAREMKPGERRELTPALFPAVTKANFYVLLANVQKPEHPLFKLLAEAGAHVEPGGYKSASPRPPKRGGKRLAGPGAGSGRTPATLVRA